MPEARLLQRVSELIRVNGWWPMNSAVHPPQHFLYFLPLPQGLGSFLPIFGVALLALRRQVDAVWGLARLSFARSS
jgi:hypothetical protein